MDEVVENGEIGQTRPSENEGAGERKNSGVRASIRASIRNVVEVAGRVQRRAVAKVSALRGNVQRSGSGAATSFLQSGFLCRLGMLLPAGHTWLKIRQMSVLIPYSVRVALIGMKVISAAAMGALFFSSSAPTPDSDPDCTPPEDQWERLLQTVIVGLVTAFLSDGIIFILFMVQRKSVVRRKEWTERAKARQRMWWRFRTGAFWLLTFLYSCGCQLYTLLFLANVRKVDSDKWLESFLWTLFQDLLLKPFLVALILTTMSSLVLCCRPSIGRTIEAEWTEEGTTRDEGENHESHDPEPEESVIISAASSDAEEESDVKISHASSEPEVEEEAPAKVVIDRDQKESVIISAASLDDEDAEKEAAARRLGVRTTAAKVVIDRDQKDFHGILPGTIAN